MNVERITVTPEMASAWLCKNDRNRKMRSTQVARIASDIREGRWEVNGDTIRLDTEGYVLDGQHRLAAIIQAGIPVETYVATGIDRKVAMTIDTGLRRSTGDVIRICTVADKMFSNGTVIAFSNKLMLLRDGMSFFSSKQYSAAENYEFSVSHRDLMEFFFKYTFGTGKTYLRGASFPVGLMYGISSGESVADVKEFIDVIYHNRIVVGKNVKSALDLKEWYQVTGHELRPKVRDEEIIKRTKSALYCFIHDKQKTTKDYYQNFFIEYVNDAIREEESK